MPRCGTDLPGCCRRRCLRQAQRGRPERTAGIRGPPEPSPVTVCGRQAASLGHVRSGHFAADSESVGLGPEREARRCCADQRARFESVTTSSSRSDCPASRVWLSWSFGPALLRTPGSAATGHMFLSDAGMQMGQARGQYGGNGMIILQEMRS